MPVAGPTKVVVKAGGATALTTVETAFEVTERGINIPPPETVMLTAFVPVVVDFNTIGNDTGALRGIEVVRLQDAVVVPVQVKPEATLPDDAGTSVIPAGNALLTVVVPIDAVVPVSVTVAVYVMLLLIPAPIGPIGVKAIVKVTAAEATCAPPKNKAHPSANDSGFNLGIEVNEVDFLAPVILSPPASGGSWKLDPIYKIPLIICL
ncbi:MAG: hypothetical protein ABL933_06250 [Methyloglobulus sp.]|nr:hypothetical protein [Methyloglobulus sp.]